MSSWHGTTSAIAAGHGTRAASCPAGRLTAADGLPPLLAEAAGWPRRSYREFAALPSTPSRARRQAREELAEWGLSHLSSDTEIVVSELTTNALLASGELEGPTVIRLLLLGGPAQVTVVVWDASTQPPAVADPDHDSEHGRGLPIVSALSSDWGWYRSRDAGGKCVWSEIGGTPPASPA
jgi:anti-sigma regulatory factor (Ser/Thr protein kinase)